MVVLHGVLAIQAEERRYPGRLRCLFVSYKLGEGKPGGPVLFQVGRVRTEVLFQYRVCALCLAIYLEEAGKT